MVLKKPYAFIIKHFRLIHIFLLLPMFYLAIKTRNIADFLNTFVKNDYTFTSNVMELSSLASNYINILMYLSVIIILATHITLSFVLQLKDKPTKYYNISIIYYIGIFILITAGFSVFSMIENDLLEDVFARIIRDLSWVVYLSEYIFIILTFIRGIGFNIKKFNFQSDIESLEISSEDSEEFEFLVGLDTYKTKRTIRRFIRELKYYYKENKFIFNIVIIISVGIIGTTIYMNREVNLRDFKEGESLAFGYLNLTVTDTHISNLTHNGKVLKDDKYYFVMELKVVNRFREDKDLNFGNIQLIVDDKIYLPDIPASNYFIDFGNPYQGTGIKGVSQGNYILVYEIDKRDVNKDFYLNMYTSLNKRKVIVDPDIINSNVVNNRINAGVTTGLGNTNLKNSKVSIINYEVTNRFVYNYRHCSGDYCYQSTNSFNIDNASEIGKKTFLVLGYSLELDEEAKYLSTNKNYKDFFKDFLEIKYKVGSKEYVTSGDVMNNNYYSDRLVLKVPYNIIEANEIDALITIRNVSYSIKLK